ncbi:MULTISPECIES: hypothetical protein [Bifidobacterium]|jgi:hypothetical protein|nr:MULTISPECIES: hypothetical protein [Bifidobacterium]MDH7898191.1 hypothetical protein [Bifidobacterium catenulatum subsp. kashiwanohense]
MFIGIITIAVQQEYPSTHAKHLNNPSKLNLIYDGNYRDALERGFNAGT